MPGAVADERESMRKRGSKGTAKRRRSAERVRAARWVAALALIAAACVPALSYAHAERESFFPDFRLGEVPKYRTSGEQQVVCKGKQSKQRIRRRTAGRVESKNLRLLGKCEFRHIQAAVDAATNGDRIMILPGVYKEQPSRRVPDPDPRCSEFYEGGTENEIGGLNESREEGGVPSYEYQYHCPNSQNLIAIMGDSPEDEDRICDEKCDIQIEGTGNDPRDVKIVGDRSKLNVVRADRADGIHLRNFLVQFSDFNNVYALETNGFRFTNIESRWSREYGFLSFTSDNGLYQNLTAYGAGDSGVYPGSGPQGHCGRYGIEMKRVNSFGSTIGYSGTAGDGVDAHHNTFHHNATGLTMDSFASGHPGMPQNCSKFKHNQIHSNNLHVYSEQRDRYCNTDNRDIEDRNPRVVCPTFPVPTGTGLLIAGGNANIVRGNQFWSNWRIGAMLLSVPAAIRGENDPSRQFDTSHGNRFTVNNVGRRPPRRLVTGTVPVRASGRLVDRPTYRRVAGKSRLALNGVDFWWDEEGTGNCWQGNARRLWSGPATGNPRRLPTCPGRSVFQPADPQKQALLAPCATWDSQTNPDPPGCSTEGSSWFERPRKP